MSATASPERHRQITLDFLDFKLFIKFVIEVIDAIDGRDIVRETGLAR